ncbi:hypothetical protein IRZ83_07835 [Flavobacterium sp. JLP]|uniref:hypothetical protein n=1 Tax=Flavobacterium sp. JLP TaxID=2783793 RepID=UPI00188B65EE|nr:hypothetical protein [Flavobacterium sp. JLP]MBF4506578.1 hypothetical protein [Flavobacterium sp. JLP]
MIQKLEIFLTSDQPTTCPKCGNRTKLVKEFELAQQHECLSEECNFQFVLESDNEDEI